MFCLLRLQLQCNFPLAASAAGSPAASAVIRALSKVVAGSGGADDRSSLNANPEGQYVHSAMTDFHVNLRHPMQGVLASFVNILCGNL